MKYPTKRFKCLTVGLKELEPFIRNGKHLQSGRPFKRFGSMRSREALANLLLCAVDNHQSQSDRLTFTSDPIDGDGIIVDTLTEMSWPTEHVMVPRPRRLGEALDVEALILKAIEDKRKMGGRAYASGKTLVVFLDAGGGPWWPNKVARRLPVPLYFDAVWVVGLQIVEPSGEYVYGVTRLDIARGGNVPAWRVRVAKNFDAWTVEPLQ
jgi:hypothetical protein